MLHTLELIASICFAGSLFYMFLIILGYMAQEYENQKPERRHKRILKIIARDHKKPIQRGYTSPEGYLTKVELMDMRGELNQNEYYADHQRKVNRRRRASHKAA